MHPFLLNTLRTCLQDSLGIFTCHIVQFIGYYGCNNILVSSFGCTYDHFCMGVHLETKAIVCANPTCGKILFEEWITSVGFNHINMKFKRPKLEMPNPRFIRFGQFDL